MICYACQYTFFERMRVNILSTIDVYFLFLLQIFSPSKLHYEHIYDDERQQMDNPFFLEEMDNPFVRL